MSRSVRRNSPSRSRLALSPSVVRKSDQRDARFPARCLTIRATGLECSAGLRKNSSVVEFGHRPVGHLLVMSQFMAHVGEQSVHLATLPSRVTHTGKSDRP